MKDFETDYITGCCMFVRSTTIFQMNGFDESFRMYMEDVDFCLRARAKGFKSYFLQSPKLYHYISSSVTNKSLKIISSYIKLSMKHTGIFCLFNVPLFILRKIFTK